MANEPLSWLFKILDAVTAPAKSMAGALGDVLKGADDATKGLPPLNDGLGATGDALKDAGEKSAGFRFELGNLFHSFMGLRKEGDEWVFNLAEGLTEAKEKVVELGREVVHAGAAAEDMARAYEVAVGKENVEKFFSMYEGLSSLTGRSAQEIKEAALPLIQLGADLGETRAAMKAAADVAATSGGRLGMNEVVQVLGMVRSTGMVRKMTLSSMGIPIEEVARAYAERQHVTMKAALKAVSSGGPAQGAQVEHAILEAIAKTHGGKLGVGAQRGAEDMSGILHRLGKLSEDVFEKISETKAWASLKAGLNSFLAAWPAERIVADIERIGHVVSVVGKAAAVAAQVAAPFVAAFVAYKAVLIATEIPSTIMAAKTVIQIGLLWAQVAAQSALNTAMLANPIGFVIAGIVALGVAVYEIYKHWDGIKDFFAGVWETISRFFAGLWASTKHVASAVWHTLSDWAIRLYDYLAHSWFGKLIGFYISTYKKMFDVGATLIKSLAGGIVHAFTYVKDAVEHIASSTVDWLKSKLHIHSPSKVFADLGGHVSEGFALGIVGGKGRVRGAIDDIVSAASPQGAIGFSFTGGGARADVGGGDAGTSAGRGAMLYFSGPLMQVDVQGGMSESEIEERIKPGLRAALVSVGEELGIQMGAV